mgnify:CR=1 FL=1
MQGLACVCPAHLALVSRVGAGRPCARQASLSMGADCPGCEPAMLLYLCTLQANVRTVHRERSIFDTSRSGATRNSSRSRIRSISKQRERQQSGRLAGTSPSGSLTSHLKPSASLVLVLAHGPCSWVRLALPASCGHTTAYSSKKCSSFPPPAAPAKWHACDSHEWTSGWEGLVRFCLCH